MLLSKEIWWIVWILLWILLDFYGFYIIMVLCCMVISNFVKDFVIFVDFIWNVMDVLWMFCM